MFVFAIGKGMASMIGRGRFLSTFSIEFSWSFEKETTPKESILASEVCLV